MNIFTQELLDYDFKFDAICIQESWLGENDDPLFYSLDGYIICISHQKTSSSKGGLMIYLKNEYSYKVMNLPENSNIWESQLIEISGGTLAKNIILGNINRPPRNTVNDYNIFTREFTGALEYLEKLGPEILIAGDYNIYLLDVHNRDVAGNYFTSVTAQGFIPLITFPTRFSDLRGTLNDNFLYQISARSSNATSGIMIRKFLIINHTSPVWT